MSGGTPNGLGVLLDNFVLPKRYLTPANNPIDTIYRVIRIPNSLQFIAAVNEVLALLTNPDVWQESASGLTVEETAFITAEMYYQYLQVFMLGAVFPYTTQSPPYGCLPCDGSTYLRVDYPELYNVLETAFIVDADSFKTPDLRGRTTVGVGTGTGLTARAINDIGGEEEHILTIDQMPTHTHTDSGHTHGYVEPITLAINGGLEAPASAAQPFPGVTDNAAANLENTGGDEAHNTMPPFLALNYCLVAK